MPSSSLAPIRALRAATPRDHLLSVADLLGIHPSGALMAWLLATPAAELRRVVRDGAYTPRSADHLAMLAAFADRVWARLEDSDPAVRTARLTAWRAWLLRPSLPSAAGPIRPLDRLADPDGAAEAVQDLRAATDQRRGPISLRLVSLVRPPEVAARARG